MEYLIYTGLLGLCADIVGVIVFTSILLALSWQLDRVRHIDRAGHRTGRPQVGAEIRRAARVARRGGRLDLARRRADRRRGRGAGLRRGIVRDGSVRTPVHRRAPRRIEDGCRTGMVIRADRGNCRAGRFAIILVGAI